MILETKRNTLQQLETKELDLNAQLSKLLPYAYNILGDYMEAEDVVQDVLSRYLLSDTAHVEKPESYLVRSVINHAINQKKLLRKQKEFYPGEWLPTPVATEEGIYLKADRKKILNYSLLVLLEYLSPKERTVFILKETFDYPHAEIADILKIETESSRQLLKRGKEKLKKNAGDSFSVGTERGFKLEQLTNAILSKDLDKVKELLHEEVKAFSDGGTKTSAARKIVFGRQNVSKLFKAIYGKFLLENTTFQQVDINYHPAILYRQGNHIYRCIIFEMRDDYIYNVYTIINPDKLKALNLLYK